jgi:hypothetical protein
MTAETVTVTVGALTITLPVDSPPGQAIVRIALELVSDPANRPIYRNRMDDKGTR